MAIDPRQLKPGELCRLLNSTPLGEVISERQLHRHRTRAGYRIGDGKTVDLLRYTAWLVIERHERLSELISAHRSRALNASETIIGDLQPCEPPRFTGSLKVSRFWGCAPPVGLTSPKVIPRRAPAVAVPTAATAPNPHA